MKQINKLETVTERDIDLILLEEMNVSETFCQWLAEKASIPERSFESHGAWHSITDASLGESDLIMIIESSDKSYALMIENKIDAQAMPNQGERYYKRGKLGIEEGKWDWFTTCIIAPKLYLNKDREAKVYC